MACFIVPAAEAVATTAIQKNVEKKGITKEEIKAKHPFLSRIGWLNNMLWGGTALLAFEHVWHGEVTPWFPFLTAASNMGDAIEMLKEMAVSGVAMAALATGVWAGMAAVANAIEKRPAVEKK